MSIQDAIEASSTLFAPTQGDEYLSQNLLHYKPLSAHLFAGISFAGTALYQNASPGNWHGHVVRGLAHAVTATGFVLNSFLATAEAVAALATALILTTIHGLTKADSQFLQQVTVKTWAYSVHSFAISALQIALLYNGTFSSYHSLNSLATHSMHLLSAACSQLIVGTLSDDIAERAPASPDALSYATLRTARVFVENGHHALIDLFHSLNRDFGFVEQFQAFGMQLQNHNLFQNFLQQYPAHQTILQDLSISSLCQEAYRERLRQMLADLVQFSHIGQPESDNASVLVLNTNNEEAGSYQLQLKGHIKTAFKEIHANDTLASYLSEGGIAQEGKDALEGFYPNIYIPLAYYAQLKELEGQDIVCPRSFTNNKLLQYNGRYAQIDTARKLLAALPIEAKPILIRKLMQGSSFNFKPQGDPGAVSEETEKQISDLSNKIGQLAGSLHQGNLMSQATLDIRNLNPGSNNLFQQACMEAAGELS